MKIGLISDLHVDLNGRDAVHGALVERLRDLDALAIAGDISNSFGITTGFVEDLQKDSGKPVYFVPGNHDLYDDSFEDTRVLYEAYGQHPQCLTEQVVDLGPYKLLGDCFWYDYGFAHEKYSKEDLYPQFHEGLAWSDRRFIRWLAPDEVVSEEMIQKNADRLKALAGKRIILISHMVVNRDFVNWGQYDNVDYFAAFLGSPKIGQMIEDQGVEVTCMGHVHLRKQAVKERAYYCPCLGNPSAFTKSLTEEIQDALIILEVDHEPTK